MSRPPGPCPPEAARLASQCPASLISWSGHRSGGGGQGWPFRPARPSGRKCGHQSGASVPGDVLPPACLSETSVTAGPGHCQGHLATIFRSTPELSPPLSPRLVTPLPCFSGSLQWLPSALNANASQWAPRALANLWHPCPWPTLLPSLWPAFSLLSHRRLPPWGLPEHDPATGRVFCPRTHCLAPSCPAGCPPPLHSAGDQECISDLADPRDRPAGGQAPGGRAAHMV